MFANKIRITQDYIDLIVKKRKEHYYTAYELSEKLGKNKSWIPNIENHRTKNLSKEKPNETTTGTIKRKCCRCHGGASGMAMFKQQ